MNPDEQVVECFNPNHITNCTGAFPECAETHPPTTAIDNYEPHRQGLHSDDSPYPGEPMCYCDRPKSTAIADVDKPKTSNQRPEWYCQKCSTTHTTRCPRLETTITSTTALPDDTPIECFKCGYTRPKSECYYRNGYIQRVCKPCISEQTKKRYENNKESLKASMARYTKSARGKEMMRLRAVKDAHNTKARQAVRDAVRKGTFEKTPCINCNETNSEFHHTNGYDKPNWFTGMWLCKACHSRIHYVKKAIDFQVATITEEAVSKKIEEVFPEYSGDWGGFIGDKLDDERHRQKWFRIGWNACRGNAKATLELKRKNNGR